MRCRMSAHAYSIYLYIYTSHKNLLIHLSADWRLAPMENVAVGVKACTGLCFGATSRQFRRVAADFGRAVSRILSAPKTRGRESFVSAANTRNRFRCAERGAGRSEVPYLALHPMGFSVPPRLRLERWALTPPFHPYLALVAEAGAV